MSSRQFFWLLLVLSTQYSVLSTSAQAHPVPRRLHDRVITVRLGADAVTVDYHLELDQLTAYDELPAVAEKDDLARVTRDNFYDIFTRLYAPVLASNLTAKLDGQPLEFTCTRRQARLVDSVWCDFVFRAAWQPAPGRPHTFAFYEGNYEEEAGQIKLALAGEPLAGSVASSAGLLGQGQGPGPLLAAFALDRAATSRERPVALVEKAEPDEALKNRASIDLRPGDAPRLRNASATFLVPETPAAVQGAKTTEPPPETTSPAEATASPGPVFDSRDLRRLLIDTRAGTLVLLVLAACFGAVHALTPGHGKTLVAAYLVGERGTVWHAVLLGVVTTVTHTGIVILLAVLALGLPGVQTALALASALLVVGLGLWTFLCRLQGRADHFHLPGVGHHHHHHHDHDHSHGHHGDHYHDEHGHVHGLPGSDAPVGWWGMIVLGVSGGIVPCYDAIAMFGFAISAQRVWLALPLLLAFSTGLAGVLILIGIAVVGAKGAVQKRFGNNARFRQIFRTLPLVSSALITCLGLVLCYAILHPAAP